MRTHSGNVGMCIADIGQITYDTIKKFDIPCDELHFGKPYAHFYIDDLGIDPRLDLERELGIYMTEIVKEILIILLLKVIILLLKKVLLKKLEVKYYWYNNIPSSIKHLFPVMYNYSPTLDVYDMEKISGLTMSYLYATETLSTKKLISYLETIELIHNSAICNQDINIYSNYSDKIEKRYKSFDYSHFPIHQKYIKN
jgi:hypothetical protein